MKISEQDLRRIIKESIILENKLKDFIGDVKVYDYDKDRTKKPKESEIIVKVKIGSTVENAEYFAKGFGKDNGYKYKFKKYLSPDPIDPKEGYFLFSK